jgi:hypothetical protein
VTLLDHPTAGSGLTTRAITPPDRSEVLASEASYRHLEQETRRYLSIDYRGSTGADRTWLVQHVERELNGLLGLRPGWDGRRAAIVTDDAVMSAVEAVAALLEDDTAAIPQFFPLPDGGVQVEWHVNDNHVEIEIDAAGAPHVLAVDRDGHVVVEGELVSNTFKGELRSFLTALSQQIPR